MDQLEIFPVLVVVFVSYLLAYRIARRKKSPLIQEYLFAGNHPVFAVTSNIGSVFSLSIAATALLSSGYLFGWQIIFPLMMGVISGLLLILKLFKSEFVQQNKIENEHDHFGGGASYLTLLRRRYGAAVFFGLGLFLLCLYLLLLAVELSVLRISISSITTLDSFDIHLIVIIILIGAFTYVFIGGYACVLLTDHFQVFVLLAFGGFGAVEMISLFKHLPAPTSSPIVGRDWILLLSLHGGVFIAAAAFFVASTDHWVRTIGTLKVGSVRPVLIASAVLMAFGSSLPILLGSLFQSLSDTTYRDNNVSLVMIAHFLEASTYTMRFLFFMAMTAISLSTLDTYIVTVKQLYYEISIYMRARHAVLYIFEYVLKWKQIRAISLAMVLTALGLSLTIADDLVYQVGVAALSAFIYVVPILILEIWPKILWPNNVRNANDVIVAQSVSLVVGPMAFWLANFLIAPIAVHLYLIPVAITASVICGYGGTAAAIRAPRLLGR